MDEDADLGIAYLTEGDIKMLELAATPGVDYVVLDLSAYYLDED